MSQIQYQKPSLGANSTALRHISLAHRRFWRPFSAEFSLPDRRLGTGKAWRCILLDDFRRQWSASQTHSCFGGCHHSDQWGFWICCHRRVGPAWSAASSRLLTWLLNFFTCSLPLLSKAASESVTKQLYDAANVVFESPVSTCGVVKANCGELPWS